MVTLERDDSERRGSRHLSQAISDPIRLFIKSVFYAQSISRMVEIVNVDAAT
jgi:hypothetical protein